MGKISVSMDETDCYEKEISVGQDSEYIQTYDNSSSLGEEGSDGYWIVEDEDGNEVLTDLYEEDAKELVDNLSENLKRKMEGKQ